MIIDIYSMVYNEESLFPEYLKFYRSRFPFAEFHIYDNGSTDNTGYIASTEGCWMSEIDTGGEIRDDILLDFKNNYWKKSRADWVIVCDIDEWVDIHPFQLMEGISHFVSEGYDMVGGPDTEYGVRNPMYDKVNVFNPRLIKDINYSVGAHLANPKGKINPSLFKPKMYHMRYPDKETVVKRYQELESRQSKLNKENGFGIQYSSTEEQIDKLFVELEEKKIKVR